MFLTEGGSIANGAMITVTSVRISPDLSYAKVYISVFPWDKHEAVMTALDQRNWYFRKMLGVRVRNQLRIVPELQFLLDDSLEYIHNIDTLLKEE